MAKYFKNIRGLVQFRRGDEFVLKGKSMNELPVLKDAWLKVDKGAFSDMGKMKDFDSVGLNSVDEVEDCRGKYIFPTWVDSHTHLVFAGTREGEFVDRIKGLSYAEIAERGGGILNSAQRLRNSSMDELLESASRRLNKIISLGTGAVEIKSGYGLTLESELKMLRVVSKLKEQSPILIKSTFLGAHAFPDEFRNNRQGYIDLLVDRMIPEVAEEGLADYIDVFCEQGYFSVEDTNRILEAGVKVGMKPKTHVNQFTVMGGVEVSVQHGAVSVDHLEELDEKDIRILQTATTIPVALPLCSLFLSIPYTPARRIIDAGLPLALATDYNPGSSPSGNMNLAISLASIKMDMTPEEAINAATINGAAALELSGEVGAIAPGYRANFFVADIPSPAFIPYTMGENWINSVYLNGVKVV